MTDFRKVRRLLRWLIRSVVLGLAVGFSMWLLSTSVISITSLREANPALLFLLPPGALLIAHLYEKLGPYLRSGTAQVIQMINQGLLAISNPSASAQSTPDTRNISVKMAPLLFVSTILSHLVGASTGKEGAGVQIGSSIGSYLSKLEDLLLPGHLEEHEKTNEGIWLISGAGAAFGALFNAPIAGTLFGLQFSSPNVNRTDAFMPCLISSYVACLLGKFVLHSRALSPSPSVAVPVSAGNLLLAAALALVIGWLCKLFLALIGSYKRFLSRRFRGVYRRTACASIILLALSAFFYAVSGTGVLSGLSATLIGEDVPWYYPLGKAILTIASIGAGFVGGEVIPIMVIGSTFATSLAPLLSLPVSTMAMYGAIGMLSAATNLPLACFALGMELFGGANPASLFVVSMVSFCASGIVGIYEKQEKTLSLEE